MIGKIFFTSIMNCISRLKKNDVFKNTFFSFAGKVIAMICIMLLDIVSARSLKIDKYAEWNFFFSILTMLFYIGWAGINASTKVYLSKCENADDRACCLSDAFKLRMIVSLCVSLLVIIIMPNAAIHMGYPEKYPDLKKLLSLGSILIFFNSFSEFYKEIYMGLEKFYYVFWVVILEYGGYLFFSIVMLWLMKGSIFSIVWGYFFSGICVSIFGISKLRGEESFFFYLRQNFEKKNIFKILKYAVPMALVGIGTMILVEMDTFMLGILSDKREMALYSISKNISAKITHINYSLTVGSMALFSIINRENYAVKKAKFHNISKLNIIITIIIAFSIFIFAPQIIHILYGTEYDGAGQIMKALIPYYILYSVSTFYSLFLDFRGRAKIRSVFYCSIIIINLILNYSLIPIYGAIGAAMATGFSLVPYSIMVITVTLWEWNRNISLK